LTALTCMRPCTLVRCTCPPTLPYSTLIMCCNGDHRDLHSFPTRRSSDLSIAARCNDSCEAFLDGAPGQRFRFARMRRNADGATADRKSTRLNSSHVSISYAVFCLKKKTVFVLPYRCFADSMSTTHDTLSF